MRKYVLRKGKKPETENLSVKKSRPKYIRLNNIRGATSASKVTYMISLTYLNIAWLYLGTCAQVIIVH